MLSIKKIHQIKYLTQFHIVKNSIAYFNLLTEARRYIACTLLRSSPVRLSYHAYEYPEESLKPPIFIFHGIIGNKNQWADIGKNILNLTKRKVVAVDLRNHGESPHMDSHKYTEQVQDILSLFEHLGTEQASLIGHSMGGRTAMCLALMAPQKVSGLQVVDISPISTSLYYIEYIPELLKAMKAVNFSNTNNISNAKKYAAKELRSIIPDHLLLQYVLTNLRMRKDGTIGWVCNLDVLIKDYKYWVSFPKVKSGITYDGPTLFVGGQLSEFIPPDDLPDIRSLFPRAIVTYITKATHQVQLDSPEQFLTLTSSFIKTHKYRNFKPVIKR